MELNNKQTRRYWLVASLTAASFVTGCNKDGKKWANSPGTNGFINLDAVKEAFIKNPEAGGFEGKVNEIFEGDNLIIFASTKGNSGFVYKAFEDLNKDKAVDSGDEVLFTLTVANGRATLQGNGANKYYKETWKYTPPKEGEKETQQTRHRYHRGPYFYHWYYGRSWRSYHTPAPSYNNTASLRGNYRQTDSFKGQVQNNINYENRMSKKYGSNFTKSVNDTSTIRKNYISRTKSSSGFKSSLKSTSSSGWSVRPKSTKSSFSSSKISSRSSGGSRGGFRGSSGFGI